MMNLFVDLLPLFGGIVGALIGLYIPYGIVMFCAKYTKHKCWL